MSSVRAALAIHSKENCHPFERLRLSGRSRKIVIRSNDSGYLLEKIVILSNGSGYPFEKNRHPFERLDELSVKNNCQPRYCSKPLLLPKPFATNESKNVSSNNSSKRCLPSPHKFSRYIFCCIAFFAFTTFNYRYN